MRSPSAVAPHIAMPNCNGHQTVGGGLANSVNFEPTIGSWPLLAGCDTGAFWPRMFL